MAIGNCDCKCEWECECDRLANHQNDGFTYHENWLHTGKLYAGCCTFCTHSDNWNPIIFQNWSSTNWCVCVWQDDNRFWDVFAIYLHDTNHRCDDHDWYNDRLSIIKAERLNESNKFVFFLRFGVNQVSSVPSRGICQSQCVWLSRKRNEYTHLNYRTVHVHIYVHVDIHIHGHV